MNRWKSSLLAALFAGAGLCGSAWAQDQTNKAKPDATKVVPGKVEVKPGTDPSMRSMDDNAQRQHSRDGAAGAANTKAPAGTQTKAPAGTETQAGAAGVRDWKQIDKNNDNLVQPEEMEAWLTQVGPQAKPKQ